MATRISDINHEIASYLDLDKLVAGEHDLAVEDIDKRIAAFHQVKRKGMLALERCQKKVLPFVEKLAEIHDDPGKVSSFKERIEHISSQPPFKINPIALGHAPGTLYRMAEVVDALYSEVAVEVFLKKEHFYEELFRHTDSFTQRVFVYDFLSTTIPDSKKMILNQFDIGNRKEALVLLDAVEDEAVRKDTLHLLLCRYLEVGDQRMVRELISTYEIDEDCIEDLIHIFTAKHAPHKVLFLPEYLTGYPRSESAWRYTLVNALVERGQIDRAIEYTATIAVSIEKEKALQSCVLGALGKKTPEDVVALWVRMSDDVPEKATTFEKCLLGYELLRNTDALEYFHQYCTKERELSFCRRALVDLYGRERNFEKAAYWINVIPPGGAAARDPEHLLEFWRGYHARDFQAAYDRVFQLQDQTRVVRLLDTLSEVVRVTECPALFMKLIFCKSIEGEKWRAYH